MTSAGSQFLVVMLGAACLLASACGSASEPPVMGVEPLDCTDAAKMQTYVNALLTPSSMAVFAVADGSNDTSLNRHFRGQDSDRWDAVANRVSSLEPPPALADSNDTLAEAAREVSRRLRDADADTPLGEGAIVLQAVMRFEGAHSDALSAVRVMIRRDLDERCLTADGLERADWLGWWAPSGGNLLSAVLVASVTHGVVPDRLKIRLDGAARDVRNGTPPGSFVTETGRVDDVVAEMSIALDTLIERTSNGNPPPRALVANTLDPFAETIAVQRDIASGIVATDADIRG